MSRAAAMSQKTPPFVVLAGDEEFAKSRTLTSALDDLLPPQVDRALALCTYDGAANEEQGGPTLARVLDDLQTLPFLSDRRVVVIRDADRFISACREKLETYAAKPSPTGVLVLECRAFPKTTRFYKAVVAGGGVIHECRKLAGRAVTEFALSEATRLGKRLDRAAAAQLAELLGQDQGLLAGEVEKLALYVGDRPTISLADVRTLVGQSREEKIFAVMDAAAAGDAPGALQLWRSVLASDPAASFRATGGLAFVLRRWLTAHELRDEGQPVGAIAPKVMMWGRENELQQLLRRLPAARLQRLLAQLARVDAEAKSGTRSIENGVEALILTAAGATP